MSQKKHTKYAITIAQVAIKDIATKKMPMSVFSDIDFQ
jgi:hypothetical protein